MQTFTGQLKVSSEAEGREEILKAIDGEIVVFSKWFEERFQGPLHKIEQAALKTYLFCKLMGNASDSD